MSDLFQLTFNLVLAALQLVTDLDGIFAPPLMCLFVSMMIWQLKRILYDS